jgi:hypothetical protein
MGASDLIKETAKYLARRGPSTYGESGFRCRRLSSRCAEADQDQRRSDAVRGVCHGRSDRRCEVTEKWSDCPRRADRHERPRRTNTAGGDDRDMFRERHAGRSSSSTRRIQQIGYRYSATNRISSQCILGLEFVFMVWEFATCQIKLVLYWQAAVRWMNGKKYIPVRAIYKK